MKKIILSILCAGGICAVAPLNAQSIQITRHTSVITTTVPFLIITPDSRSGAMGDAGVAISPDPNTMHWNPAKLAFLPSNMAFSLTYTPWLRSLVSDISLSYLSMYRKIDNLSGFGASLRYFSLGDIQFTDERGQNLQVFRPYEMALDGGYARKLSERFSLGLAGRFIYSNLSNQINVGQQATHPAFTFAGDISGYYRKDVKLKDMKGVLSYGGNISNIGGKISYTTSGDRDFIPVNLRLGTALKLDVDEYNQVTFAFDLNKLLVPSNPIYVLDTATGKWKIPPGPGNGKDPNVHTVQGMIQSFYDAPGGFKEEMAEINPSIGIEYWYAQQVAGRIGYFYEAASKGNRKYLTLGLGLRYNILGLDLSYLVPTNKASTLSLRSPLENTLRFSLIFNFDKNTKKKPSVITP